jgi:beta-phosphoglucomutase-like phosphatase (HAD superfamily)
LDRLYRFTKLVGAARVIVFDFDGLLADSEKYHYLAYSEVFARYGHTIDEKEYYKYWTSLGQGARGEIARHGLDLDPVAIKDEKDPIFSRYCRDGSITLFPESRELVDLLAGTGRVLTIASGTVRPDIEAILENAGVRECFAEIVGSDEVENLKPAPDVFHEVMDRVECDPFECLVFEDAEKGMSAAVAAHMPVVVVRTRQTKSFDFGLANLTLDSHAEMIELARAALAQR